MYRFVAMIDHHRKQEWESLGWRIREPNTPTHHDHYGVIGEYISADDTEPPTPRPVGVES